MTQMLIIAVGHGTSWAGSYDMASYRSRYLPCYMPYVLRSGDMVKPALKEKEIDSRAEIHYRRTPSCLGLLAMIGWQYSLAGMPSSIIHTLFHRSKSMSHSVIFSDS